jgi:hypothetical protein
MNPNVDTLDPMAADEELGPSTDRRPDQALGRRSTWKSVLRVLSPAAPIPPLAWFAEPEVVLDVLKASTVALMLWSLGRVLVASLVIWCPQRIKRAPQKRLTPLARRRLARSMLRVAAADVAIAFWMTAHVGHLRNVVHSASQDHYFEHLAQLVAGALVWGLLDQKIISYLADGVAARLLVILNLRKEADRLGESIKAPVSCVTRDEEPLTPFPATASLACILAGSMSLLVVLGLHHGGGKEEGEPAVALAAEHPAGKEPAKELIPGGTDTAPPEPRSPAAPSIAAVPATGSGYAPKPVAATTSIPSPPASNAVGNEACGYAPLAKLEEKVPKHVGQALGEQWLHLSQLPGTASAQPCPNNGVEHKNGIYFARLSGDRPALLVSDINGEAFSVADDLTDVVESWIREGSLASGSSRIDTGLGDYQSFKKSDDSCELAMRRTVADEVVLYSPSITGRILEKAIELHAFPYLVDRTAVGNLIRLTFGFEFLANRVVVWLDPATNAVAEEAAVDLAAGMLAVPGAPDADGVLHPLTVVPAAPRAAPDDPTASCRNIKRLRVLAEETRQRIEDREQIGSPKDS